MGQPDEDVKKQTIVNPLSLFPKRENQHINNKIVNFNQCDFSQSINLWMQRSSLTFYLTFLLRASKVNLQREKRFTVFVVSRTGGEILPES